MSDNSLLETATKARSRAYARYSQFAVGAALLSKSGDVFPGCNVENVSLGLTMCAERVLAEFNPEIRIVTSTIDGKRETVLLTDLLPRPKQGILEQTQDV